MIRRRRRKSNKFKCFLLFLIALCIVWTGKQEYEIHKIHQRQAEVGQRIELLKQQKAELEAERKRLDDPRYIEKLAREDYNMVGKDEVPLFIVDEQKDKQ